MARLGWYCCLHNATCYLWHTAATSPALRRRPIIPPAAHLCQQLQAPRQHGIDAPDTAEVQLSLQLSLAHAQAQQVPRRHVALNNLRAGPGAHRVDQAGMDQ